MIRKYFTVAVVWMMMLSVLQGISIPLVTSSPIDTKIREIKKISGSKDKLFVLNQAHNAVTTFDQSLKKLDTFFLATDVPNQAITPQDIAYLDGSLFITDQLGRRILQYSASGKYVQTLSKLTGILTKPSAILAYDQYLLIGDLGCIWITDLSGKILNRIQLPENKEDVFSTITDISCFENELYLADTTNNQILVYKSGENWIDFKYSNTIGGFGVEPGRFMRLTSAVGYGKLFGCDGIKKSIQSFHPLTKQVELVTNEEIGLIQPSDMTIWNQKIYMVDEKTDSVTSVPLITGPEFQPVVSTTVIDFGSTYDPAEKQFLVYNQSGYPMKGTISVSNPAFIVEPIEFSGVKNSLTVSIKENLQAKLIETGKITIHLPGNITKTVDVKVRRSSDPDFTIVYPKIPEFNTYEKQLVFTIETQNRLGEAIEIVVQNKNIPFDLIKQDVDKYALLPIRSPLPGIYSITFTAKAPRNKIIKQGTLTFLYKGFEGAVPTTVLGEYCVADWCEYCPSGHRALNELSQKMTRDQVSFLTYYTDCQQATDVRLCFDEGDKRVKWYIAGGTHVSLYLNGTTLINGGINGPDATMTTDYKEKIDLLLRKDSPISLTGSAILNPKDRSITVGATISMAVKQELKMPRLFCVIAESNIDLLVTNKEKIHNFVARQFISLPNPEKSSAYGTPLGYLEREDIQLHAKIDPLIKLENAYCVIFVQDLTTTEVFQTRFIALGEKGKVSDFSLDCRETMLLDKGTIPQDLEFQLQNLGDTLEEYWTHIPENSGLPPDTELIVNGNTFSVLNTLAVFLNPSDIATIKLHFKSPLEKAKLDQISLSVIHESTQTTKSITLPIKNADPNQPRFQVLYPPMEELMSKDGFFTNMNSLTMIIKAEPGTKVGEMGGANVQSKESILYFPIKVRPGKQERTILIEHPSRQLDRITIRLRGEILIQLTLDNSVPLINGEAQAPLEAAPFLMNGRTMVPIRFISESMGAYIKYESTTRTITINFEDTVIIMQYNNPEATINGKTVMMDAPYTIKLGRSFVPLRFIAEAFGAKVEWNPRKREIKIRL
jgi:thiol-disulfide isomerase/thioredoxin